MGQYDHLFKKTAEASESDGGIYPLPGALQIVRIDALKMITNFKNIDMFIAELTILKSNLAERPVGSTMSWTAGYDKMNTPGNVKGFYLAIVATLAPGVEETAAEIAAGMAQMVDETTNPAAGICLHLETSTIITKEKKLPFTKCIWRALTPEEAAEAAAAQAA